MDGLGYLIDGIDSFDTSSVTTPRESRLTRSDWESNVWIERSSTYEEARSEEDGTSGGQIWSGTATSWERKREFTRKKASFTLNAFGSPGSFSLDRRESVILCWHAPWFSFLHLQGGLATIICMQRDMQCHTSSNYTVPQPHYCRSLLPSTKKHMQNLSSGINAFRIDNESNLNWSVEFRTYSQLQRTKSRRRIAMFIGTKGTYTTPALFLSSLSYLSTK